MSRPQEPHRPFFPFGNPFRRISPKNSQISPKLLTLLNSFEKTLAERMRKLNPAEKGDVLSFKWMKLAMESISETYSDIKTLMVKLELPVSDWDESWIDAYLDVSVKLLDMSVVFTSELSRLNQGNLYLKCALHNLESPTSPQQCTRACSSLDGWGKHMNTKNPRFGSCWTILESLEQSLDLPKVKNSAKGKILMQAMYGVKVETVFVYSVFASAFSGSAERLFDLNVADTYLWAESFKNLQSNVNTTIRNASNDGKRPVALRELEVVNAAGKRLNPVIQGGAESDDTAVLERYIADLRTQAEKFTTGIDDLTKVVDGYFKIVMSGRDALLSNLRGEEGGKTSPKMAGNVGQFVR